VHGMKIMVHNDPTPGGSHQMELFAQTAHDVAESLGVSDTEAERLFEADLLSFRPVRGAQLSTGERLELTFLCTLRSRGCDIPTIRVITHTLPGPLAYDVSRLSFDFETGEWHERASPSDEDLLDELTERMEGNPGLAFQAADAALDELRVLKEAHEE